ncbi:MAG: DUF126 domain-containing protein, partial [Fuerstia sp.]|nr:DUF126 domain-containing protein [Fuerstiella sp.]
GLETTTRPGADIKGQCVTGKIVINPAVLGSTSGTVSLYFWQKVSGTESGAEFVAECCRMLQNAKGAEYERRTENSPNAAPTDSGDGRRHGIARAALCDEFTGPRRTSGGARTGESEACVPVVHERWAVSWRSV